MPRLIKVGGQGLALAGVLDVAAHLAAAGAHAHAHAVGHAAVGGEAHLLAFASMVLIQVGVVAETLRMPARPPTRWRSTT